MGFAVEKDTQWSALPPADVSSEPNSRKHRSPKRPSDAGLEVLPTALGGETVRGLIDDWLIQAMVNRYLNERLEAAREEHNRRQT